MNSAFLSSPLSSSIFLSISGGMRVLQKPVMRRKPPYAFSGMMPGRIGAVMPFARQLATKSSKTAMS